VKTPVHFINRSEMGEIMTSALKDWIGFGRV
jgi:hypothetical protein